MAAVSRLYESEQPKVQPLAFINRLLSRICLWMYVQTWSSYTKFDLVTQLGFIAMIFLAHVATELPFSIQGMKLGLMRLLAYVYISRQKKNTMKKIIRKKY